MNKMLGIIRNFIQAINFFEEKSVLYRDNFIESSKKEPSLTDYNRGETMVERMLLLELYLTLELSLNLVLRLIGKRS